MINGVCSFMTIQNNVQKIHKNWSMKYSVLSLLHYMGNNTLDPAIAANARSKSLYSERPTRSPTKVGRIGIELDGVEHLFRHQQQQQSTSTFRTTTISCGSAVRQISILLAIKLSSRQQWKEFEDTTTTTTTHEANEENTRNRPVILVFNTVKEALAARSEMRYIQQTYHPNEENIFDEIIIQTIADRLPPQIRPTKEGGQRQRRQRSRKERNWVRKLSVNPSTSGIVLVCQPTDFSYVFQPPGPSVNTVTDFQKLIFRALLEETPVVVLSPRFLSQTEVPGLNRNSYQRADFYGGREPPNSPELFLMRDFSPPSFSYIALQNDYSASSRRRRHHQSPIVLMNTVMDMVG